jgi:pyruvate dehydrogenase E2 component (dihydrolipoamide acetyltransferase)
MATDVVMPQMGESIAEGTITKWLVKVGDTVARDQPLFEISTDKVDAEIPSPAAGTLLEIRSKEGETVPVNQVVASIGEAGESSGAQAAPAAKKEEPKKEAVQQDEDARQDPKQEPKKEAKPTDAPAPARPQAVPTPKAEEQSPEGSDALGDRLRQFSSPLVRNIASKEGVDIREISGTGAQGRVTKSDILGYLEQRKSAPAAAPARPQAVASTATSAPAASAPTAQRATGDFHVAAYSESENVEIEPMSRIRQITAAHMVYSKATSAHVTTIFHMDMSRVARARQRAKEGFLAKEGTKLTYMPFIFKSIANGLKAHKKLNAAIDGSNVVYKLDINLGMAVDLGRGLIVPVIKHADQLNLVGLAKGANDLADRARNKKLKPEETQGGTFTITNPGVFGSLFGTPIINQPQVAILGVGAVEKRPIVVTDADGNDAIVIKTMCYFGITYDHRLVDGADADRFMVDVKKTLEEDAWTELEAYS